MTSFDKSIYYWGLDLLYLDLYFHSLAKVNDNASGGGDNQPNCERIARGI